MANFPGTTIVLVNKADLTDTVNAADVNSVYDEVKAIGSTFGVNPQLRTSGAWGSITSTSAWTDPVGASFATVKTRMDNIELGVKIATNNLVNQFGGSTITPSGTGVVGVKLKAVVGGTNLLEVIKAADSSASTYIKADATLVAADIDGGGA